MLYVVFVFKQKTADEMRISDWSSDVCSSDLPLRDVREWGKIAKDIIVWDYVIQFNHLISPFPNLHVLQPNIKFFADNGVSAMFEQGNREEIGRASCRERVCQYV